MEFGNDLPEEDPEVELPVEPIQDRTKLPFKKLLLAGVALTVGTVCFVKLTPLIRSADLGNSVSLAGFNGVALNTGNANYDTVFNQTLFDCVQNSKNLPDPNAASAAKGKCFDDLYSRDGQCRQLAQDPVKGTCLGLKACLLAQPYGPIQDPCWNSCGQADSRLLKSCQVQFSALRLLARTCVPQWVIHDQQTDWRLYQVRDMINGITKRCGKPIVNDPFFAT